MDIDNWDWNAGVGMTAISDYYEKMQNPEIHMANWIARNKHQCVGKHHMSGALWTRGNSWVVIGAPIIIETLRDMVEVPKEIHTRYKRLVDGILKYQRFTVRV